MPQATLLSYLTKPSAVSSPNFPSGEVSSKRPSVETIIPSPNTEKSSALTSDLGILEKVQDQLSTNDRPTTIPHIPNAQIVHITKSHLPAIQRLTSTTLPVRYGDNFFQGTITDETAAQLSRVVLCSSEPVGWIRCCLEPCGPEYASQPQLKQIYIQALALLAPYRRLGLATILLDTIINCSIARAPDTVCIYAHVWEKNEDALEWYAKRGFKRVLLLQRYYRRLNPPGAWIVRKELENT
jgi:ribosomal protein S18 acetylase RimI-like enzyme